MLHLSLRPTLQVVINEEIEEEREKVIPEPKSKPGALELQTCSSFLQGLGRCIDSSKGGFETSGNGEAFGKLQMSNSIV